MPKSLPCCHFLFFSADINHHTWWDRPVRSPETIQSNGYFQLRTGLQNHNPWVRTWPAIPNQYASWTLNHAEPSGQWHFIVELVPLKDLQGPIAPWHLMPAGMKDSTVHWTCRTLLCHGSLQIIPSAEILINYKKTIWHVFAPILSFFDGWNFGYESVEWAIWSPWPLLSSHYCLSSLVLLVNSSGSFVS
jgi:hypothetical protein